MLVAVFEGLGHRDEKRAGRLEPLDELCKVGEGTGQPVDLVDHNLVDETCVDVGEQALQVEAIMKLRYLIEPFAVTLVLGGCLLVTVGNGLHGPSSCVSSVWQPLPAAAPGPRPRVPEQ